MSGVKRKFESSGDEEEGKSAKRQHIAQYGWPVSDAILCHIATFFDLNSRGNAAGVLRRFRDTVYTPKAWAPIRQLRLFCGGAASHRDGWLCTGTDSCPDFWLTRLGSRWPGVCQSLELSNYRQLHLLLQILDKTKQHLISLTFSATVVLQQLPDFRSIFLLIAEQIPKLQSVCFKGHSTGFDHSDEHILLRQSTQLRTLILEPQLSSAELTMFRKGIDSPHLSALTSLSINIDFVSGSQFFDVYTFPSLTDLSVQCRLNDFDPLWVKSESLPSLRHLELDLGRSPHGNVLDELPVIGQLETLCYTQACNNLDDALSVENPKCATRLSVLDIAPEEDVEMRFTRLQGLLPVIAEFPALQVCVFRLPHVGLNIDLNIYARGLVEYINKNWSGAFSATVMGNTSPSVRRSTEKFLLRRKPLERKKLMIIAS